MTAAAVCDVAYALLVEQVRGRALVERQIAAGWAAAGARVDELPDPDAAVEQLDVILAAEPRRVDPEQAELARALGVG